MAKPFHSCTQPRRSLQRSGSLNLATGEMTYTSEQWVEGPCDKPLFGEEERRTGICRSCANGWTHPHNFPLPRA